MDETIPSLVYYRITLFENMIASSFEYGPKITLWPQDVHAAARPENMVVLTVDTSKIIGFWLQVSTVLGYTVWKTTKK